MSNSKPQEALQLGLNVLIDQGCEGNNCRYHSFPYEIDSILSSDQRKKVVFNNLHDVWNYVKLLQIESDEHQKEGSNFNTLNNVSEQLPFFMCPNNVIDENSQKDISRYIYTKETGTQPYSGSYGDTPKKWIQKYFIIKQAMMMRENKLRAKAQNGNK